MLTEYDDGEVEGSYKGGTCNQSHCHRCGSVWLTDQLAKWETPMRLSLGSPVFVTYADTAAERSKTVRYLADQEKHGRIDERAGGVVPTLDGRFLILSTTPTKTYSAIVSIADASKLVIDHLAARQKQAQADGESPAGNPSLFGSWKHPKSALPNSSHKENEGKQREARPIKAQHSYFAPEGANDGALFDLVTENGGQVITRKAGESWKFRGIKDPDAVRAGLSKLGLRPQSELQDARAAANAEKQLREMSYKLRVLEYDREAAFA